MFIHLKKCSYNMKQLKATYKASKKSNNTSGRSHPSGWGDRSLLSCLGSTPKLTHVLGGSASGGGVCSSLSIPHARVGTLLYTFWLAGCSVRPVGLVVVRASWPGHPKLIKKKKKQQHRRNAKQNSRN